MYIEVKITPIIPSDKVGCYCIILGLLGQARDKFQKCKQVSLECTFGGKGVVNTDDVNFPESLTRLSSLKRNSLRTHLVRAWFLLSGTSFVEKFCLFSLMRGQALASTMMDTSSILFLLKCIHYPSSCKLESKVINSIYRSLGAVCKTYSSQSTDNCKPRPWQQKDKMRGYHQIGF